MISITDQYQIDIIQEAFEHFDFCSCSQEFLNKIPTLLAEKIKKNLSIHLYSDIELQKEQNPTEIFRNFHIYFFKIGRFPDINNLAVV